MEGFVLPGDLARELCARLGVRLPSGPADLDPLYRAWCALVPSDNVAKGLAVAEGRIPPGDDPVAAVEQYLATGLGGTCWAHVSALTGLLTLAGARATVGLDRMARTDGIVDFHSFVVVHEAGEQWLLDTVWPSGPPLRLRPGARGDHPVIGTGLDADGDDPMGAAGGTGGRLAHWARVGEGTVLRYRLLSTVLDRDDVRAFCALSARFSGITTDALVMHRKSATGTEGLRPTDDGSSLYVRRWDRHGHRDETFTDPDAAFAALGCTPAARRLAERAGLLGSARR